MKSETHKKKFLIPLLLRIDAHIEALIAGTEAANCMLSSSETQEEEEGEHKLEHDVAVQ